MYPLPQLPVREALEPLPMFCNTVSMVGLGTVILQGPTLVQQGILQSIFKLTEQPQEQVVQHQPLPLLAGQ
jgi:hypothetical protein